MCGIKAFDRWSAGTLCSCGSICFFPWVNVEHDLCFKRTSKSALNVLNSKHVLIMVFKGQMLGMKIRNKPSSTLGGCGASYKSELVVYCKEH